MHCDAVDTVADLGIGVGEVFGLEAAVDRLPGLAAIVGAECTGGRDGNEDALGVGGVENNGVQAHAARAGLPLGSRSVAAQRSHLVPGLATVGGAEECGIFDAGVDGVRIAQ